MAGERRKEGGAMQRVARLGVTMLRLMKRGWWAACRRLGA